MTHNQYNGQIRRRISAHISPSFLVGLLVLVGPVPAFAQGVSERAQNAAERPAILSRLDACRTIESDSQRLACYDETAAALDTAQREGQVVAVDRRQMTEVRRQLFGFEAPSLSSLFGRSGDDEPVNAVETTLTGASMNGDGKWVFRLADGSVWLQIDSAAVRFSRDGSPQVRVRRASLGSYQLVVGSSRAVRVRRQ